MELIYKPVNDLKPYENNPRQNDDAVRYVANYKIKVKTVQSLIGANTNGKTVNEYLYSNQPIQLSEAV